MKPPVLIDFEWQHYALWRLAITVVLWAALLIFLIIGVAMDATAPWTQKILGMVVCTVIVVPLAWWFAGDLATPLAWVSARVAFWRWRARLRRRHAEEQERAAAAWATARPDRLLPRRHLEARRRLTPGLIPGPGESRGRSG